MLVLMFVAARKPNNPSFSCRALRKRRLLVLPICLRAVRRASVQYVNAQSSSAAAQARRKLVMSGATSQAAVAPIIRPMGIMVSASAPASKRSERRNMPIGVDRSEEHTSELQSLMRISYAVFCLKKKTHKSQLQRRTTVVINNKPTKHLKTTYNNQY